MKNLLLRVVFLSALVCICVSCATDLTGGYPESIRIGYGKPKHEYFSLEVWPLGSDLCIVGLQTPRGTQDGPVVGKSFPEMLSLVDAARDEVVQLQKRDLADGSEMRRLSVSFGSRTDQVFSIEGGGRALHKIFRESPALRELLTLTSRSLPKNYRILD